MKKDSMNNQNKYEEMNVNFFLLLLLLLFISILELRKLFGDKELLSISFLLI